MKGGIRDFNLEVINLGKTEFFHRWEELE